MSQAVSILAAKNPDAPINLANAPEVTSAYQIGLTWDEGVYNGGSPVIDYMVLYTTADSDNYQIYSQNLLQKQETVTGLTPGVSYKFITRARNVIGFSVDSSSVTILAAQVPDAPLNLVNVPLITNA